METLTIPGTEITAPRVALGAWAIGGWMWGGTEESDAIRTIHAALERGIRLIDTAPVYGFGRSEEIVGKALAGERRHRAIVATKVGLDWKDGSVIRNSSPERVRREIEDSLRRLRTDVIDLYQVHWPDPKVPVEETAAALARLREEGKIRAIGVSNYSPAQMAAFRRAAPLHTVQPPYNLFERGIERDVLPAARAAGIPVLAYSPLCRGLLSGRMTAARTFHGDDLRKSDPKFLEPRFGRYLAAVSALARFARERYGRSVPALAARWILDQGGTIVLWGARKPEQLEPVEEVPGWSLDAAAMEAIDAILRETIPDPVGPEFMAPP